VWARWDQNIQPKNSPSELNFFLLSLQTSRQEVQPTKNQMKCTITIALSQRLHNNFDMGGMRGQRQAAYTGKTM
jgi:hypothetical protein